MKTHAVTPPGPRGYPLLGSLPTLFRDPLRFYREMALDYGPMAYATFGAIHFYMVNDPALIEELLVGRHKECIKDHLTRDLEPLVGKGLLTSEGDFWKRQRKLASPPLQPKRIAAYAQTMVECTERALAAYQDGQTIDLSVELNRITLEIVSKTLLGVSTAEEASRLAKVLHATFGYYEERMYSWKRLLPKQLPLPSALRFRRALRDLDAIVEHIIAEARREGDHADHLLARLLKARADDGAAMSQQQLHDEAVTMLLAGHETTALALTYALYLLARNPREADKLRSELDSQLGGRSARSEDLARLPYLDAVVRETLRIYTPAYAFGREVVTPFELGGYRLEAGSQVTVAPFGIHRNPRYFPEPERFLPERWLGPEARALPRMAYIPFGGGPRICIGSHFAMMEAALVLATLMQQVELTLAPDFVLQFAPAITLRPRGALPVRVRRRPQRAQAERHSA